MRIEDMHHQYIRAELRKLFGTIADFERARRLPAGSVHDVLRGRPNSRTRKEIESVLTDATDTSSRQPAQPQNVRAAA